MASPKKDPTFESELKQRLRRNFGERYGQDADGLADVLQAYFEEQDFDWETTTEDFEHDDIDECDGIDTVIKHLKLEKKQEKLEAFDLYKWVYAEYKHTLDDQADVAIRFKNELVRSLKNPQADALQLATTKAAEMSIQLQELMPQFSSLAKVRADVFSPVKDSTLCQQQLNLDPQGVFDQSEVVAALQRSVYPMDAPFSPRNCRLLSNIADRHVEYAKDLLKKHCSAMFKNETLNKSEGTEAKDKTYKTAKAVDLLNKRPIMLFLMDTFARLRMAKLCKAQQIEDAAARQEAFQSIGPGKWTLKNFLNEYKGCIDSILSDKQLDEHVKLENVSFAMVANALPSAAKRVVPPMRLSNPLTVFEDDLKHYADYALAIARCVRHLEAASSQPVPFQIDVVIIPQCVKDGPLEGKEDVFSDDESENEDGSDEKSSTDGKYVMGLGIGSKGTKYRPMIEIPDIGEYLKQSGYEVDKDYVCQEMDDKRLSNKELAWRKFDAMRNHMCGGKENPTHQRIVFIVDRRNIDPKTGIPRVAMGDKKKWKDMVYCIKPKAKEHNTLPECYEVLPEALFSMTQQLLLPANPTLKEQNGGKPTKAIGIRESLNGYMFAMSFHVFSAAVMRAYFSYGGQMQRFYMRDVVDLWPMLFAKDADGKPQSVSELQRYELEGEKLAFLDRDFEGFLSIFEEAKKQ